jgi:hypothetical protein
LIVVITVTEETCRRKAVKLEKLLRKSPLYRSPQFLKLAIYFQTNGKEYDGDTLSEL